MNGLGIESVVKYTIGGIFAIAALSFIAKDGQQIGAFITAVGNGFGSFAKQIQAT